MFGLPQWLSSKESACNSRVSEASGSIFGSEISPAGEQGNPLRDSCLENPMDKGVWWVTVLQTSKNWTWLKQLGTRAHEVYVSVLFSQISHPLLLPLSPKVCSLHLCLLCCPECRIISTIFLNSIYVHQYTMPYLSISDLFHSILGSRFVHLVWTDSNVFLFMAE